VQAHSANASLLGHLRTIPNAPRWWAFGALLLIMVAVLSLVPLGPAPVQLPGGIDKYEHFAAYAALAAYFGLLVRGTKALWISSASITVFGVLIEFAQAFGGVRSGDWRDVLANTVGVAVGSWFALRFADKVWERVQRWRKTDSP
jgi:VanZ family protein